VTLPDYSPNRPCPKCRHYRASTRYVAPVRGEVPEVNSRPAFDLEGQEFLLRTCDCCEYQWAEAVVA
jgi:predicted nucleic-acid-binding Zn-ribbon protein